MGGKQLLFRSIIHNTTTNFANTFANTVAKTMKSSPETQGSSIDGCFAINKPSTITSAQVIRNVQKHFDPSRLFKSWIDEEQGRKDAKLRHADLRKSKKFRKDRQPASVKMGHGGTLDPLATGVLVLGVGSGTKSLNQFLGCTKSYEAVLLFGAATDTYDTEGRIVARKPHKHITRQMVEEALMRYQGKIMQKPPIYSALRVQGKRLYEYAREGKEVPVEIKERPVEVLKLDIMDWMEGGTHTWHWPTIEAEPKEMELAANILNLTGTERFGKKDDNVKNESSAIEMSGVLPNDSAIDVKSTQDASFKRKRHDDETVHGTVADAPSSKRAKSPSRIEVEAATLPAPEATAPPPELSADSPSRPPCPAPAVRIRMTVGSGFYVRSLCHDLGADVGSLGIMAFLVRSRQGEFELGTNVLEYDDLAAGEEVWGPKVQEMLQAWQRKEKPNQDQIGAGGDDKEEKVKKSIEARGEKVVRQRTEEASVETVRARRNSSSSAGDA